MRDHILAAGRRFISPARGSSQGIRMKVISMAWDKGSRVEGLFMASWQGKRATFRYKRPARPGLKRHRVEPYGMGLYRGSWYLVARDEGRGGVVTFRLSRIFGLKIGAATGCFQIPKAFDVRDYVGIPEWTFGTSPRKVKVRVSNKAREAFLRIPPRFVKLRESAQGGLRGYLWVGDSKALARYLLPFGNQVRVESPENVRTQIYAEALRVSGFYT